MKLPLYTTDLNSEDVPLPKLVDGLMKLYHHSLHPRYRKEDIPKAREVELKSTKGILGRIMYGKKPDLYKIEDVLIKNKEIQIPMRIYQPHEGDLLPVIIFFHGGGYVQGSVEIYDHFCRSLAKDLNTIIVSVDYRLAPESPYPGGVDDCFGATRWVFVNIDKIHGDPQKIMLMGDSAGGGLTAIIAQGLRKEPDLKLYGQILLYPWVDLRLTQKSIDKYDGYVLTKKLAQLFIEVYVPDDILIDNPRVSPLYASDLSNLPRSLVITGSHDPLRDEGNLYAKKLRDAGNQVLYKNYLQTFHGFLSAAGVMPRGKKMYRDFIITLKRYFFNGPQSDKLPLTVL